MPVGEEARHAKERSMAGRCFGRVDDGTRSLAIMLSESSGGGLSHRTMRCGVCAWVPVVVDVG